MHENDNGKASVRQSKKQSGAYSVCFGSRSAHASVDVLVPEKAITLMFWLPRGSSRMLTLPIKHFGTCFG